MHESIDYKTRQEIVCDVLREAILRGELRPGESLNQQRLAERYNVSRMPIREAIRVLAAEGLVSISSHRGTTVVQLSSTESIEDLFSLRALLEGEATRIAVDNMTSDTLDKLAHHLDEMDASEEDTANWILLNETFHETLYRQSHRPILFEEITRMRNRAQPYFHLYKAMQSFSEANDEHRAIYAACLNRDRETAYRRVISHLDNTKIGLIAAFLREQDSSEKCTR